MFEVFESFGLFELFLLVVGELFLEGMHLLEDLFLLEFRGFKVFEEHVLGFAQSIDLLVSLVFADGQSLL